MEPRRDRRPADGRITGEYGVEPVFRVLDHERRIDALERDEQDRDKEHAVAMTEIRHRLQVIEQNESRARQMTGLVFIALLGLVGSVVYGIYSVGEKFGTLAGKIESVEKWEASRKSETP